MNIADRSTNIRFSLTGKLSAIVLLATTVGMLVVFLSLMLIEQEWVAMIVALPIAYGVSLWLVYILSRRLNVKIAAIKNGLLNVMDNDFSVSIAASGNDELGTVIAIYNQLAEKSRRERQYIYQRELLLDTVIQHSSMCVALTDQSDRVIYSNYNARTLFNDGKPINGLLFADAIQGAPDALKEIISQRKGGLFRVRAKGDDDLYHISAGQFIVNSQQHNLILIKQMTQELHRQEAAVWKKVIRTISHELNNSLAPISSMAHSGRLMLDKKRYDSLAVVFETIGERAEHLKMFIDSYAGIAKLPLPNKQSIEWKSFVQKQAIGYAFIIEGEMPEKPGIFDPVQIGQVIVNLLKNAHESGSASDKIALRIRQNQRHSIIEVVDRGTGMSANVMENALLPFYTTKPTGSGVGLPLCREIVEAHYGELSLSNRKGGGLEVRITLPA